MVWKAKLEEMKIDLLKKRTCSHSVLNMVLTLEMERDLSKESTEPVGSDLQGGRVRGWAG